MTKPIYTKLDRQEIKLHKELSLSPRLLIVRAQLGLTIDWVEHCAPSTKEAAIELRAFLKRLLDPMMCNDNCKSMYFCTLEVGHEGNHCEYGALSWPPYESGYPRKRVRKGAKKHG